MIRRLIIFITILIYSSVVYAQDKNNNKPYLDSLYNRYLNNTKTLSDLQRDSAILLDFNLYLKKCDSIATLFESLYDAYYFIGMYDNAFMCLSSARKVYRDLFIMSNDNKHYLDSLHKVKTKVLSDQLRDSVNLFNFNSYYKNCDSLAKEISSLGKIYRYVNMDESAEMCYSFVAEVYNDLAKLSREHHHAELELDALVNRYNCIYCHFTEQDYEELEKIELRLKQNSLDFMCAREPGYSAKSSLRDNRHFSNPAAALLNDIGNDRTSYEEKEFIFKKCLNVVKNNISSSDLINSYENLVILYYANREYEQVVTYAEECYEFWKLKGDFYDYQMFDMLECLVKSCYATHKYDKCLKYKKVICRGYYEKYGYNGAFQTSIMELKTLYEEIMKKPSYNGYLNSEYEALVKYLKQISR